MKSYILYEDHTKACGFGTHARVLFAADGKTIPHDKVKTFKTRICRCPTCSCYAATEADLMRAGVAFLLNKNRVTGIGEFSFEKEVPVEEAIKKYPHMKDAFQRFLPYLLKD